MNTDNSFRHYLQMGEKMGSQVAKKRRASIFSFKVGEITTRDYADGLIQLGEKGWCCMNKRTKLLE